jgi:hypothetical protein
MERRRRASPTRPGQGRIVRGTPPKAETGRVDGPLVARPGAFCCAIGRSRTNKAIFGCAIFVEVVRDSGTMQRWLRINGSAAFEARARVSGIFEGHRTMDTPQPQGITTGEYSDLLATYRHYSTLRFSIMTVFIVITSGLFSVALGLVGTAPRSSLAPAAKVAGLFMTAVFFCFEERIHAILHTLRNRAIELENALGYDLWRRMDQERRLRVTLLAINVATRALYCGVAIAWLWSFWQ